MKSKLGYEATHQQILQINSLTEKQFPGTDISRYNDSYFQKAIQQRMENIHCATPDEYLKTIAQNPSETGKLTDSLTNSYSEFFRNPLTFSVLDRIVLPSLMLKNIVSKNKEIRIWSAACVIAQTAYGLSGDKELAIKPGCNDYIAKPLDIAVLKGMLHKYFT